MSETHCYRGDIGAKRVINSWVKTVSWLSTMRSRRSELRQQADAYFESGGKAERFAQEHGVPRTTVIGWRKVWLSGEREPDVVRPLKLEPFKSAEILEDLFERRGLVDCRDVGELIENRSTYKMKRLGITRYLRRWQIMSEGDEFQRIASILVKCPKDSHTGCRTTSVWVDCRPWIVPDDLKGHFGQASKKNLWRMITRRGMECFTFTDDLANDAMAHIAELLSRNTSWQIYTDRPQLIRALRERKVVCVEIPPINETEE